MSNQHVKQTYASIMRPSILQNQLKREQAIVLTALSEIPIKEYVLAVGKIINPNNILLSSKISKNRICIYLKSKETVDRITKKCKFVEIQNHKIEVRPLIVPAKRIIITNACPTIPHNIIENVLKTHGIEMVSKMKFISAGIHEPGYEHILSFRRQVFIKPDDNNPLPETFLLNYESTDYRIFLSETDMICNMCKRSGHFASQCENSDTISSTNIQNNDADTEGYVDNSWKKQDYDKREATTEIQLEPTKKLTKLTLKEEKHLEKFLNKLEEQLDKQLLEKQQQQQHRKKIQQYEQKEIRKQQQKQNKNYQTQHQKQQQDRIKHQPKRIKLQDKSYEEQQEEKQQQLTQQRQNPQKQKLQPQQQQRRQQKEQQEICKQQKEQTYEEQTQIQHHLQKQQKIHKTERKQDKQTTQPIPRLIGLASILSWDQYTLI